MKIKDIPGISPSAAAKLGKAGIFAVEQGAAFSDDELLAIDGVGGGTVEKIRAAEAAQSRLAGGSAEDAEPAKSGLSWDPATPDVRWGQAGLLAERLAE